MNQAKLFGQTQQAFNLKKLVSIQNSDKANDTTFKRTKEYFLKYFAKSLEGYCYCYEPSEESDYEGEIHKIKNSKLKDDIFENIPRVKFFVDGEAKEREFSLFGWFQKCHHETFKIASDPREKQFFTSKKTGRQFINISKGFLHKNKKTDADFSNDVIEKRNKVLNHIKNIWNSGDEKAYEYTITWLAHALNGHKMQTALFLKSDEGTGKSLIVEFLINHVIGSFLGIITQRVPMKFNYHLVNKILLCLEELPSSGKNEWHSVSDYLKDLITGSKMDIEKKYEDVIQLANLISLIIITNNENSIRFGKDIRRYHMCDISHDKVGDTKYFDDLYQCLSREVGECFFWYINSIYEKTQNFKENEMPMTNNKLEIKDKNLTPILQFLKNNFISLKRGIAENGKPYPLNQLLDEYNEYSGDTMKIKSFHNKLISSIPLVKTRPYGTKKTLHIQPLKYEDLIDFYKKRGYWDDKFDMEEKEENNNYPFINTDVVKEEDKKETKDEIYKRLYEEAIRERNLYKNLFEAEMNRKKDLLIMSQDDKKYDELMKTIKKNEKYTEEEEVTDDFLTIDFLNA